MALVAALAQQVALGLQTRLHHCLQLDLLAEAVDQVLQLVVATVALVGFLHLVEVEVELPKQEHNLAQVVQGPMGLRLLQLIFNYAIRNC